MHNNVLSYVLFPEKPLYDDSFEIFPFRPSVVRTVSSESDYKKSLEPPEANGAPRLTASCMCPLNTHATSESCVICKHFQIVFIKELVSLMHDDIPLAVSSHTTKHHQDNCQKIRQA